MENIIEGPVIVKREAKADAVARARVRFGFALDDYRPFNNVLHHRTVGKQIEVLEDKAGGTCP
jgi:hypothetical protein